MVDDLGLTLSGGGNRSFHQMGLMRVWAPLLLPRLTAIAACSAGACVMTLLLSGRERESLDFWKKRREGVTRNLQWTRLLRGKRPAPHAAIYRDTLLFAFAEGGLERIRAQPFPLLILCAAMPRWLGAGLSTLIGFSTYSLEKRLKPRMLHPSFTKKLGFRPFVFDARRCVSPQELADLVLASSATPPFTPVGCFRNRKLLDGGLFDNVPAFVADHVPEVRRNLVLLTRTYPQAQLGLQGQRLYLAPSQPVPVNRWDYTRPDLVEATLALGERDADLHKPLLLTFLEDDAEGL